MPDHRVGTGGLRSAFSLNQQRKTTVNGPSTQTLAWLKTVLTVAAIFAAIVAAFSLSAGGGQGEDTVVAVSAAGVPVPAEEAAVPAGSASAADLDR